MYMWCCVLCWWCVGVVVCVCMWCCAYVLCGGGGVVRCVGVVLVLCWCCVGVGWGVCVFSFFLSIIFILFLALSLSFLLHSSLLSSLFSSGQQTLYKSTDQQTWRPTLRRLNVIWRTASAQHSLLNSQHLPPNCTECCHVGDGSLPPPLSSSLLPRKKRREPFISGIFPARELFFITVSYQGITATH